jgi:putative SOS response-associated peptidase YedK
MCGRLALYATPDELVSHFGIDQPPTLTARYNVTPGTSIAVVARKSGGAGRGLALVRWGLVPDWEFDPGRGRISARAETVARLPTFADSFRERRCIVPANGFYEYRREDRGKIPYRFFLQSGAPMGLAGLWAVWRDGLRESPKPLVTCCVVTVEPNELVGPYHDRMPVILSPHDYDRWLDNDTPPNDLKSLLKPYPAELMAVAEANRLVNSWKNEGPQLLDPAAGRSCSPLW